MSLLTTIGRSLRRPGLPAFCAAIWLCLGVQPCALAAAGDSECPHRPQEASTPAAHHGHGGSQDSTHCDVAEPPCCEADAVTVDGRPGAGKQYNDNGVDGLPATADYRFLMKADPPPTRPFHAAPVPPPGRPLHVLHCVFLD